MHAFPASLDAHRVQSAPDRSVVDGRVRWAPVKSLWFLGMAGTAAVGGAMTFSLSAASLFVACTATVLLFGHSLGSHRKLIHDSFQCPRWLEYLLVWCGVQVGLAGPIGLLRQHELRDYAQRLPDCHGYLRHGRPFWLDAWWQLNCDLVLDRPPQIAIEPRIANDRFYRFLERTWMLQQLPPAVLLYAIGGWSFVIWGTCARVTAGVFGHWLIGYFAHNHGGMHHVVQGAAVQGRNIRFTSLLTMGESWHNNHHAFPGSARLGLFPGEWDPGWWMLVLLRRLGLVHGLRLAHHLPHRSELLAHDAVAQATGFDKTANTAGRSIVIRSPCAVLSSHSLREIAGVDAQVSVRQDLRRLVVDVDGERHEGLAALCRLAARRRGSVRLLARIALPIAACLNRCRVA